MSTFVVPRPLPSDGAGSRQAAGRPARAHRPIHAAVHALVVVLTVLASAGVTYTVGARGAGEQWGATDAEAASTLPGDELIADASTPITRAVTIDATPAQVWPWIAQFGQGRGGLYSYDWLENLFGCDIHSLDHIDATLQRPAVGDRVHITPDGYPADLGMVVDQVVPERALVLRLSTTKQPFARDEAPWTWAFVLDPLPDGRTRLVSRERYREAGMVGDTLSRQLVGPIDLVMSRRMLTGIAERAELAAGTRAAPAPSEWWWFGGVLLAAVAFVGALVAPQSHRRRLLTAAVGSALLTLAVLRFWTPLMSLPLAALAVYVAARAWRRAALNAPGRPPEPGSRPVTAATAR